MAPSCALLAGSSKHELNSIKSPFQIFILRILLTTPAAAKFRGKTKIHFQPPQFTPSHSNIRLDKRARTRKKTNKAY